MKRNIRDKNKNKGDSWIHRKMLKSIRREHTRPLCNKALWHYHMNTPFHTLYSRDDSSNGSSLSRSSLGEHGTPFPSMHYGTPFPSLLCTILCETSSPSEHGTPFLLCTMALPSLPFHALSSARRAHSVSMALPSLPCTILCEQIRRAELVSMRSSSVSTVFSSV